MSVTIDGTNGVNSSGSFYGQSTYTGSYTDGIVVDYTTGTGRVTVGSSDGFKIRNGGPSSPVDLVTVDSSGNVGIGTGSIPADCRLAVSGIGLVLQDAAGAIQRFNKTLGTDTAWVSNRSYGWHDGNGLAISTQTADALKFGTNSAERARIDSNGWVFLESIPTTAVGANMYMDAGTSPAGKIYRSTSSLRYKTDVVDLTSEKANRLFNFRPVEYKSLSDTETPAHTYYGFIAEELAQVEPRLVHWIYDKDQYEDVDGELKLKEDAVKIPDGVQYDRITALLVKTVQEQQAIINAQASVLQQLQVDVAALKGKA